MSIFGVKLPQKDSQKGKVPAKTAPKPARSAQVNTTRTKGLPALPEKPQARAADTEKPLPSPVWPGIISAVLLGALYGTGREKVAQGLQTPILVGNAVYAGYWYFSKPKPPGEEEVAAAAEEAARQEQIVATGQTSSRNAFQWGQIADKIHGAFKGFTEDEDTALAQLLYVWNDADYLLLESAYGTRSHMGKKLTLAQAFKEYCTQSQRDRVNTKWATRTGLTYRI